MNVGADELLDVVPDVLAVTFGADHVLAAVSPLGTQVLGAVCPGDPLPAAYPEAADALDTAYGTGEATTPPRPTLLTGAGRAVRCTPLGRGRGRITGLMLRVVSEDEDRSRARTTGFQQLTEQLSRAAGRHDSISR